MTWASALLFAAQAAIFPHDGAIGIVPAPGWHVAQAIVGLRADDGAVLTLTELPPSAYSRLVTRLDSQDGKPADTLALSGPGEAFAIDSDVKARLYRGTRGGARHWLLLAADPRATVLVDVALRAGSGEQAIAAMLRSVRVRSEAEWTHAIAALPFTVGDPAGFRPVRTLGAAGLLLTDGPLDQDLDGAQANVVVTATPTVAKERRVAAALDLFLRQPGLTRVTVATQAASPDGEAHDISGTAVDRARYVRIHQHVRFRSDGSAMRVVCTAPVADDIATRCATLTRSVRWQ